MTRSFTVRLALPPRWYELGRDDPDAWMGAFVLQTLPAASDEARDTLAGDLLDIYGLADQLGAVDALVHVPEGDERPRAVLLTYPVQRRAWLRRGVASFAAPEERRLRAAGPVQRAERPLASGPAVRLRAVAPDELGRTVEQVLHVVLPPGAPGAVVVRMQWPPGRSDAEELATTADAIARDALVEAL